MISATDLGLWLAGDLDDRVTALTDLVDKSTSPHGGVEKRKGKDGSW